MWEIAASLLCARSIPQHTGTDGRGQQAIFANRVDCAARVQTTRAALSTRIRKRVTVFQKSRRCAALPHCSPLRLALTFSIGWAVERHGLPGPSEGWATSPGALPVVYIPSSGVVEMPRFHPHRAARFEGASNGCQEARRQARCQAGREEARQEEVVAAATRLASQSERTGPRTGAGAR